MTIFYNSIFAYNMYKNILCAMQVFNLHFKFHASTSLVWSNLTFYQIVVKIPATLSEWQKIDFVKKKFNYGKKTKFNWIKKK